jgi:orotidine-5'-phosphate decarboxylase
MNENLKKVMVALDYEHPEQAYRLVDEIGDMIDWFKLGPMLFTRSGQEVVNFLHRRNKNVFLDLKIHDTPTVAGTTIKQFADMGAQFATIHCLGGRRMLESASMACRGSQLKLIGVTLLTSHLVEDTKEFGLPEPTTLVPKLLTLALENRLAGVMCSPHELSEIRPKALPGFVLVTPGIRMPNKEVFEDDQKRVASPDQAVLWGADYLVVGRPITQAREPRDAVERLFKG